jgi:hypothetical protein
MNTGYDAVGRLGTCCERLCRGAAELNWMSEKTSFFKEMSKTKTFLKRICHDNTVLL